jgi:hypothetical protein
MSIHLLGLTFSLSLYLTLSPLLSRSPFTPLLEYINGWLDALRANRAACVEEAGELGSGHEVVVVHIEAVKDLRASQRSFH